MVDRIQVRLDDETFRLIARDAYNEMLLSGSKKLNLGGMCSRVIVEYYRISEGEG